MSNSALGIFLTKFQDWRYCPPSDNLWTVSISLSPRKDNNTGKSDLGTLYNNILNVNATYDNIFSPRWKVDVPKDGDAIKESSEFVVNALDGEIGLFLANSISFNHNEISINDLQSHSSQAATGFISYGKIQNGRDHNHKATIEFYKTNWDFNEIFIDTWIAAIGQQGLIEDSSMPNIKATIEMIQYAAGTPGGNTVWVPRKKITLTRAFPCSRKDANFNYEYDNAGSMKTDVVNFEFDAYQIYYYPYSEICKAENKSTNNDKMLTVATQVMNWNNNLA